MRRVSKVVGTAVVIDRDNIDTDQIIPSRYLKKITRTGYAEGLFAEWRRDPTFPLNDRARRRASVLITGANFGCGSSREHAAWAMEEWGFRAVIAPSFADIFRNNVLKIGLVPVILPREVVREFIGIAQDKSASIEVDVRNGFVRALGIEFSFALDSRARSRLLDGLDDIALTSRSEASIAAYESSSSEIRRH